LAGPLQPPKTKGFPANAILIFKPRLLKIGVADDTTSGETLVVFFLEGSSICMALFGLILKIAVSLFLWPLALCMAWALLLVGRTLPWNDPRLWSFSGGMAFYTLIQIFFWRPLFIYVMGHELTHALAAVLQGGQADDLRVSTKGGMVKVNVSNFLVNLAPYFFPIYTFLLLLVYWVAAPKYQIFLIFLLGISLAFHLALTVYSLSQHQSDISEVGWLFAIPFIAVVNLAIIVCVLHWVLPGSVSLRGYALLSLDSLERLSLWGRSLF
jgi:hypothetical protein